METAIKKSIEGGYTKQKFYEGIEDIVVLDLAKPTFLIDPEFWRCLGKAMGKEKEYFEFAIWRDIGDGVNKTPWWIAQWHRFTDHLIAGKNVDDFFNELLK